MVMARPSLLCRETETVGLDHCDDLPDTQPNTQVSTEVAVSSGYAVPCAPDVWGKLFPMSESFFALELCRPAYTFGRSQLCDVVYREANHALSKYALISKVHFKLLKELGSISLEDLSFNGTFVNKNKVGKGQRVLLESNDVIALSDPRYDAYVFISTMSLASSMTPSEVGKKYVVSRLLGTGTYGEVRLVFDKTSQQRYAMKTVLKNNEVVPVSTASAEAEILLKLKNDFIIKIIEIIDLPNSLHLILELMEGGPLFTRLMECQQMKEDEGKWVGYQICKAVQYMHSNNISHRDLKLDNVLMRENKPFPLIKLADFGMARMFGESQMKTFCGTAHYMAPEIIISQGIEDYRYSKEVDIWSLGVLLYLCLSGQRPFTSNNPDISLRKQILKGNLKFPKALWSRVTSTVQSLIRNMLTIDPTKRVKIDDVITNPWFMDDKKMLIKLKTEIKEFTVKDEDIELPNKKRRLELL